MVVVVDAVAEVQPGVGDADGDTGDAEDAFSDVLGIDEICRCVGNAMAFGSEVSTRVAISSGIKLRGFKSPVVAVVAARNGEFAEAAVLLFLRPFKCGHAEISSERETGGWSAGIVVVEDGVLPSGSAAALVSMAMADMLKWIDFVSRKRSIERIFPPMRPLIKSSLSHNPLVNLAYEDYLLRHFPRLSPAGRPILFMWRDEPCVVVGRNQVSVHLTTRSFTKHGLR